MKRVNLEAAKAWFSHANQDKMNKAMAEAMIRELELLRDLEKAVRADRVGCMYVKSHYDRDGHWLKDSYVSTQSALKALEEME